MNIKELIRLKREEVNLRKQKMPLEELRDSVLVAPDPYDFVAAIAPTKDISIIAEVCPLHKEQADFNPEPLAEMFKAGGANALCAVTDEMRGGRLRHAGDAKDASGLPVLLDDIIVDEYQILEAVATRADAVRLIVRVLSPAQLNEYIDFAREFALIPVVEAHDEKELYRAISTNVRVIAINNRSLATGRVDLMTTERMARDVPEGRIVVSMGGIDQRRDVEHMALHGAHAVLVGEYLLNAPDIEAATRELTGVPIKPQPQKTKA